MPKGVSAKGYKMTENRKQILSILVEEGDSLKSREGRATSLMHGLLDTKASVASVNTSLKQLETLGFIKRESEGRNTYALTITPEGKQVLVDEGVISADALAPVEEQEEVVGAAITAPTVDEAAERIRSNGASDTDQVSVAPVPEEEWDWTTADGPGGIDYDILLGVFLKAAVRGMQSSSNGEELEYYKQQATLAQEEAERWKHEAEQSQAEAAQAISQRDQLEKNLNVLMARFEKKANTRGSDPIRKLLKPEEVQALDALMRQIPTRRGE